MNNTRLNYLLCLFLISLSLSSCDQPKNKDKERLAEIDAIFNDIKSKYFNPNSSLLYGFYFCDKSKSNLEDLKNELVKEGYTFSSLEFNESKKYLLRVEKQEKHTAPSLLQRENELDELAQKFNIEKYDGWDVGCSDASRSVISAMSLYKALSRKTSPQLYKMAGELYENRAHDKAVIALQNLIDRNYKTDTCYFIQGICQIESGAYGWGMDKLQKAIKINPKYERAYYNIAGYLYEHQDYEGAIRNYKKTVELNPKNQRAYYSLAASQFVNGQIKEAKSNCEMAVKLDPKHENAAALLEHIKSKE